MTSWERPPGAATFWTDQPNNLNSDSSNRKSQARLRLQHAIGLVMLGATVAQTTRSMFSAGRLGEFCCPLKTSRGLTTSPPSLMMTHPLARSPHTNSMSHPSPSVAKSFREEKGKVACLAVALGQELPRKPPGRAPEPEPERPVPASLMGVSTAQTLGCHCGRDRR